MKLYKLTQFGLQYMMFTVSKLGDNVLLLKDYLKIQEDKKAKMAELVQQQEETLKRLRNKKKTLSDAEKQYSQIVKTLHVEPNIESKENGRNNGNVSGGEGDSYRASNNNIPKKSILKKDNKKPEPENVDALKNKFADLPASEKNEFRRYIIQEQYGKNQPPLEDLSVILGSQTLDNKQSGQETTNKKNSIKDSVDLSTILATQSIVETEKSQDIRNYDTAKKRTGEEREKKLLLQDALGKSPPQVVDLDTILASQATMNQSEKSTGTRNVEQANKQNKSNIKVEDQEIEEGEIYEDDYEDDFELSQSQVKSTMLGQSSKLRESKGEYNGDDTASFDVSTVTQKNFDGGYLEKLDRIVSKNKGDVELHSKDFSK